MSVRLPPSTSSERVPSLQELCAVQVRKLVDSDLKSKSQEGTLAPSSPSRLSLTTAKVLEVLRSLKTEDPSVARKLPWTLLDMIAHPYALVEYQNSILPQLEKEQLRPSHAITIPETEHAWRTLCQNQGYQFKEGDPAITWEQLYFKERVAQAILHSYGNFTNIAPEDWYLFNQNRSRIQVLEFVKNPWITAEKLNELCTLFSEVTALRVSGCSGMEEKDWTAAFSRLKKIEHLDLGNHMTIREGPLAALAKNAGHLRSLDISGISYCIELKAIVDLVRKATHLETLKLGDKKFLQGLPQLKQVLDGCPNLRTLELSGFKSITVKDVDVILSRYPNIQKLTMKDCPGLRADDVDSSPRNTSLRVLELVKCKNMAQDDLAFLVSEKFPALDRFICCR
ncbi:MAG: hypothetical protein JSS60_00010 [Verrucomicrobia bacterium]|nr:hypothetical protein [Verrucomicrobiota bacterium]